MEKDEFYTNVEPLVIIDDDSDYDEDLIIGHKLGPDISIIPVKSTKLMNYYNEISIIKSIKNDSSNSQFPHTKRKSAPLEKCHICKKFFRRMSTHLQKHAESQQLKNEIIRCEYCNKLFHCENNFTKHLKTHTKCKPYVCDICNKGFTQSCNLINHKRVHTGEKPFKCPHCERAFTQSGNLNNHIRLHLDQKPFQCHFCVRAFTQSGNLNSHIRNNHKNEDIHKYI